MLVGLRSKLRSRLIETWATVLDFGGLGLSQFTSSARAYVSALSEVDQVSNIGGAGPSIVRAQYLKAKQAGRQKSAGKIVQCANCTCSRASQN